MGDGLQKGCNTDKEIIMKKTFIIGEIGINHNGDIAIAKELIDWAVKAGADAVKFQKRTVEKVYTKEELDRYRESPWGTTNREQKMGLEFGKEEYDEINRYCREKGIEWFASAWDLDSQDFLAQYDLKYNKIASAMLTNMELLNKVAKEGKYTFVSTGMSSMEEIDAAVDVFRKYGCPFELVHCNSTYPMKNKDANLAMIKTLRDRYGCEVGYSGHETGRIVSFAAAVLGASSIERHITLNVSMYGSDQAASLQVEEFERLVRDIRSIPAFMGTGEKLLTEEEMATRKKLRGC